MLRRARRKLFLVAAIVFAFFLAVWWSRTHARTPLAPGLARQTFSAHEKHMQPTGFSAKLPGSHIFFVRRLKGGLGNQMFQYASLYCVAVRHNAVPVLPPGTYMSKVFKRLRGKQRNTARIKVERVLREKGGGSYVPDVITMPHVDTEFQGYFISYKYLKDCSSDIRHQFVFEDTVYKSVSSFLREALVKVNRTISDTRLVENVKRVTGISVNSAGIFTQTEFTTSEKLSDTRVTLIGIHVRRGDKVKEKRLTDYGYVVPDAAYFRKAMAYYRKKHSKIVFIVCTDDKEWVRLNILKESSASSSIVLSPFIKAEEDMAVLSVCDHVLLSDGSTFGFWGAYLSGGEVVYWSNWPRKGSSLDAEITKTDYWPPEWVSL